MYAVIVGRERKVVNTWSECQELVKGFPKNVFKKVNDEEEGQELIDNYLRDTVEKQGFEDKRYHIYSSLPMERKTPNVVISIRAKESLSGFGNLKIKNTRVVCTIKSQMELDLPKANQVVSWDKVQRYIYEVEYNGLEADPMVANFTTLYNLFSALRIIYPDISIMLNTDSNLILHSLQKNITKSWETVYVTNIKYENQLKKLYLLISSFNGLVLNYESGDRMSTESHYINLYLKGEYDIYE